jgi:hypothetical protein
MHSLAKHHFISLNGQKTFSCENLSTASESRCRGADGPWGDDDSQHRWFNKDEVPIPYHTYLKLRGSFPPEPEHRESVYKSGARAVCWPSAGVIWIQYAVSIKMFFLEISHMYNTR